MNFIQTNSINIICALIITSIVLFILIIIALCKISKMKKRFDAFAQTNTEGQSVEQMLIDFIDETRKINTRYENIELRISDVKSTIDLKIDDIYNRLRLCNQKVGVIRYNPFENVGGELSFALAILNENDDGIILNSIYSREGCYVYAKNIVKGCCNTHKLSNEEETAISMAINSNNCVK